MLEWEIPLSKLEDDFRFDHRLEGDVEVSYAEYDSVAECIVLHIDLELDDIERIPESDSTGSMIRR